SVAEPLDDPRDPLTVEVLAGDDDDAAAAEVVGGGQDAAVPERHDRLLARAEDLVQMLGALGAPAKRRRERRHGGIADGGNEPRLQTLRTRRAPVLQTYSRSLTNVMRSTN